MGDSAVVVPGSHDGGPLSASQVPAQNVSQSLATDIQGDNSRRASNRPPNLISSSSNYTPTQAPNQSSSHGTPEAFNMTNLGANLPDMSYQNYGQRFSQNPGAPAFMYQMPNASQYMNHGMMSPPPTASSYPAPYQNQYAHMYTTNQPMQAQNMHIPANNNQFYANQSYMGQQQSQSVGSQYFVQPGTFNQQSQMYIGNQMAGQYQPRSSFSGDGRFALSQQRNDIADGSMAGQGTRTNSNIASSPTQSSVVRGPPRKPRQSGHAIWIGNLPPQTDLMSLVLHVCKETSGLESLFLISKSNCAFANFKDEAACVAAQAKIHDSRFQTVRLVSRLRKASVGSVGGVAVPTGPAALTPPQPAQIPSPTTSDAGKVTEASDGKAQDDASPASISKDKFFVVKSLTVEDLELSVRNGIWATQTHNEEALNKAYQTADNVYLIFSANKSGEYFGYARMISPINEDPAAAIEFAPKAQTVEDPDLPKAIPTPATEFTPKGRIIDDSARGTIFWEVERDDVDGAEDEDEARSSKSEQDSETPSKAWGKPFKVEWVSTTRLPFYRTRGLRNPWNSNREVKIARDGTELETSIGKRLIGLFHRLPSPVAPSIPQMQGMPVPMMGGYPQLRPYA
ncbi:yt521-b-like splicing protein [Rutstroemia sp. NJR-2017a WRK4]|nr:yt521-b-like splicing protein [Rutstroemia sp. NJR-2017a WRK4]